MLITRPLRLPASPVMLLLVAACACAQEPPIAHFDFEQDELIGAWSTTACEPPSRSPVSANVRSGNGA